MSDAAGRTKYDLEDRTARFAAEGRGFVRTLPSSIANGEDSRQLVRASGSLGANYIEANEAFSKKGFITHIEIRRKPAKECRHCLGLVDTNGDSGLDAERGMLMQEAFELMSIFAAILRNSE